MKTKYKDHLLYNVQGESHTRLKEIPPPLQKIVNKVYYCQGLVQGTEQVYVTAWVRISQPHMCWHFGSHDSIVVRSWPVYCRMCSRIPRLEASNISVSHLWQSKTFSDGTNCAAGTNLFLVENSCTWWLDSRHKPKKC